MKRAHDPEEAGPLRHLHASPTAPTAHTAPIAPAPTAPTAPETECPVCCESYTRATRKPIACSKCEYAACMACCKKHLTTTDPAACMSCSHVWDYEFLTTNFTAAWISHEYRAHRETILIDREIAQLPASQHLVTNERISLRLKTDLVNLAREKIQLIRRSDEIEFIEFKKRRHICRIIDSQYEKNGIVMCPTKDCTGSVDFHDENNKNTLKCDTCDGLVCVYCYKAVTDDQYVTWRDRDSCQKAIDFERDGIDVHDHPIETKYEYFQPHGGESDDRTRIIENINRALGIDFVRDPRDRTGKRMVMSFSASDPCNYIFAIQHQATGMHSICRNYCQNLHLRHVDEPPTNSDIRREFMMNEITLDEFRCRLYMRERRRAKMSSIRDTYARFVKDANVILLTLIADATPLSRVVDDLKRIVESTNAQLNIVANVFGSRGIDEIKSPANDESGMRYVYKVFKYKVKSTSTFAWTQRHPL
jgi:hypothetical protein